ncbi:MAG: family 78 glycoside hydrolase catalytic domain [Hespellia sp.]|nr:family 78 glycoside hydrolase catalytic domain [Hespellia sp.]
MKKKRYLTLLLAFVTAVSMLPVSSVKAQGEQMGISQPKVENMTEPLGVDDPNPAFSWKLNSDGYDKSQSAYQIIVSSTRGGAEAHKGDLWDSGKTEGSKNYDIVYQGEDLSSRTEYFWTVQSWDEAGQATGWSEVSSFVTGIFSQEEWKGDWIGVSSSEMTFEGAKWIWKAPNESSTDMSSNLEAGTQYFRQNFTADTEKQISNVYLGITADDEYTAYINGDKVGENGGEDAWKNGILYDVTSYIEAGDNSIAVSATNTSRGYSGLLGKIEIVYSDGSIDTVVTDENWKVNQSEVEGWEQKDIDDASWDKPTQYGTYGIGPWGTQVSPTDDATFRATVLRKEFKTSQAIKNARAYISGPGFFELKINGQLPDDSVMNCANTQYTQTVLYRVFDVTSLIKDGDNAIGVELGNSFYNETCSVWNWQDAAWRDDPKLRMELEIEYEDGTKESVVTDETWRGTKNGPITSNSIYYGETYDARKELTGYDEAGYDEQSWGYAQNMEAPEGTLKAQLMDPIRRTKSITLDNSQITKLENGSYVLSVPEMLAGWIKLDIKDAQEGDKVTVTYGEKLKDDGQVEKLGGKDGVNSGWWPRAYNQQDNYICKGGQDVETFEPKFSYKGYQYVQIDGYRGELTGDDLVCYRVSNDQDVTGSFETSDTLLNSMHQMMMTTMNNNMQGKPTDTPVWEKNGWLGDANVALQTMNYNYDYERMLTQFIETMEDCQNELGNVPNMVPTTGWGNDNSVVWNSIFVFGVDEMIKVYGNESYLSEQYEAMRVLALKDIAESEKNGWTWSDGQLADWVSPMGQDNENADYSESPSEGSGICGTGFAYHLLDVMKQLAERLGKTEDAAQYSDAMANIYTAFNDKFYDSEKQIYRTLTWSQAGTRSEYRQTSQLVPLAYGLVPEEYKEAVVTNLVKDIRDKEFHLDTGCVGTKLILPVLTDNGYADVAYKIAQQVTYPSWGFMSNNGTSLWEMWETTSRSLGHYFLGTYDEWFYSGIGGIKDISDGYQAFTLEPNVGGGLTYANTSVETVRGNVKSNWTLEGSQSAYDISVPVGATATIVLPGTSADAVTSDGKPVTTETPGVHSVDAKDGKVTIVAGSGNYTFSATVAPAAPDKIDLRVAINNASALKQIDYDQEAWNTFSEVLDRAIAVRDDAEAQQETIDSMTKELAAASAELKNHINQSRIALKEAIAASETANPTAHPKLYVNNYNDAYQAAVAGSTNVDLTNEELDQLTAALTKAKEDLDANTFENYALRAETKANSSNNDDYWGWNINKLTDGDRKNINNKEYAGYCSSGEKKESDHQEWVSVDLGDEKEINSVTMYGSTQLPDVANSCYSFPKTFDIQVSTDGTTWTTVHSEENYPIPSYGPVYFTFEPVKARYVKIDVKNLNPKASDNNFYYMQLTELEVYNSEQEITAAALSPEYKAPEASVLYGNKLADFSDVNAELDTRDVITGTWTAFDSEGEAVDINSTNLDVGNYSAKLTFTAPDGFHFASALAGDEKTVEENGKKLVFTYTVEVKKAAAPQIEEKEVDINVTLDRNGSVDLGSLIQDYGLAESYTIGEIQDEDEILDEPAPAIDPETSLLTFTAKLTAPEEKTAVIPVTAVMKNYEDIAISVRVNLTGKTPVTIRSTAEDTQYTQAPYEGLAEPEASVPGSQEAYAGGFTVTYSTPDQTAPVDSGTYTVTIEPQDKENYVGSWSGSFTISPKEITVKTLDKTIETTEELPSLEAPVLGEDYTVDGLIGEDALVASVTMQYLDAAGNPVIPDTSKAGSYVIDISNVDAGGNYTVVYEKGALSINAKLYNITVTDGTANKQTAAAGESIAITANKAAEGKEFRGWTSDDDRVIFEDASKESTVFTMPAQDVTITANYQDKKPGSDTKPGETPGGNGNSGNNTGGNSGSGTKNHNTNKVKTGDEGGIGLLLFGILLTLSAGTVVTLTVKKLRRSR